MCARLTLPLRFAAVILLITSLCGGSDALTGDVHAAQPLTARDPTVPLDSPVTVTRGGVTRQVRAIRQIRMSDGRRVVADRLIVGFEPGVGDAEKEAVHRAMAPHLANIIPTPLKPVGDNAQYVD